MNSNAAQLLNNEVQKYLDIRIVLSKLDKRGYVSAFNQLITKALTHE